MVGPGTAAPSSLYNRQKMALPYTLLFKTQRIQIEKTCNLSYLCGAINSFWTWLVANSIVRIGIQSNFVSAGLTFADLFPRLYGVGSTWERAPGIGNNQRCYSLKHTIVRRTVGRRGGKLPGIFPRGLTDICQGVTMTSSLKI